MELGLTHDLESQSPSPTIFPQLQANTLSIHYTHIVSTLHQTYQRSSFKYKKLLHIDQNIGFILIIIFVNDLRWIMIQKRNSLDRFFCLLSSINHDYSWHYLLYITHKGSNNSYLQSFKKICVVWNNWLFLNYISYNWNLTYEKIDFPATGFRN